MQAPSQGYYQGPHDERLPHSLVEGVQPVSRIGEIVGNCVIDHKRFHMAPNVVPRKLYNPADPKPDDVHSYKPHYHEWSSVLPGMLLIGKKEQMNTVSAHRSSEKGMEVLSCAYGIGPEEMDQYYFAGVARSKSVQPIADGAGPQLDEFFTAALGGMA